MSRLSLTGNDVVQVDDRILNDVADGDYATLEFDDEMMTVKRAKNGNTIYAANQKGFVGKLTVRVLRGSADDKYLLSRLTQQKNDPSTFTLMTGAFTKRVGDGSGNKTTDVYQLSGGAFTKNTPAKSSAEGDTEQSVSVYVMTFGDAGRSLQ